MLSTSLGRIEFEECPLSLQLGDPETHHKCLKARQRDALNTAKALDGLHRVAMPGQKLGSYHSKRLLWLDLLDAAFKPIQDHLGGHAQEQGTRGFGKTA